MAHHPLGSAHQVANSTSGPGRRGVHHRPRTSFAESCTGPTRLSDSEREAATGDRPTHDDGPQMRIATDQDEEGMDRLVDAIYAAALSPALWSDVLARLADLFHSGFADVFTRSRDGDHACGLVHGLDAADYDDQFLGLWRKRNVWRNASPVRCAGEVSSTRSLIDVDALRRSEMYNEYLHPRGLHEGMRLALSVDSDEVQVISVLRPWSRGAFGEAEIALGRSMLPHLRRAAAVTRHLDGVSFESEVARCGGGDLAVVAFDLAGRPLWFNAAAEAMLAEDAFLTSRGGELIAATPVGTARMRSAVAKAVCRPAQLRAGGTVRLSTRDGAAHRNAMILPVAGHGAWSRCRPPAAIAILRQPMAVPDRKAKLSGAFDLTGAEAELAVRLLDGWTLNLIARDTRRSINTVRTHLYHLMGKAGTGRQADLIRLLGDAVREVAAPVTFDQRGTWRSPPALCRPAAAHPAPRSDRDPRPHRVRPASDRTMRV